MSSLYVRNEIKDFLTANFPVESQVDISAEYGNLSKMLDKAGVGKTDPWLALQFVGSDEVPISVGSLNKGCYREIGAIFLHIVEPVKLGVIDPLLTRAEALRDGFRGRRIGDIIVDSVTPPNTESGATLEFEGGYTSATINISYRRDLNI